MKREDIDYLSSAPSFQELVDALEAYNSAPAGSAEKSAAVGPVKQKRRACHVELGIGVPRR